MTAIKEKLSLYNILVATPAHVLTQSELDIVFDLSCDEDVQNFKDQKNISKNANAYNWLFYG
jgi:hypothetical protein